MSKSCVQSSRKKRIVENVRVMKPTESEKYAKAQQKVNARARISAGVTGVFGGSSFGAGILGSPQQFRQPSTSKVKNLFGSPRHQKPKDVDDTDGSTCLHINVKWTEVQNNIKYTILKGVCIDCDEEVKSKFDPNDLPRPKISGAERQIKEEQDKKIVESMWIRHKDYR